MNMKTESRKKKKAEGLEDLGWEALGFPEPSARGNIAAAEDYFRQALAMDPELADAYNGLGTAFYLQQRFAEAEAMYRTAFEKARVELATDKPRAYEWWGNVSTRPYMRARHNLGLVFWRQGKYREAIREFEELLRRNPHDNQGIRYLIGGIYHLSGNLSKAISYYKKAGSSWFGQRDPETEFNYGLVLFQTRKYDAAILQFRNSFLINHYLPEIVVFRTVKPLDIWHGSNVAEPEYALDYWQSYSKLWTRHPRAIAFLRLVYDDETVQSDLRRFVEVRAKLLGEKDFAVRSSLVDEELRIQNQASLEATNPTVTSRVLARFRGAKPRGS
jgi:tetratricopeptide (TPR) repeat protein